MNSTIIGKSKGIPHFTERPQPPEGKIMNKEESLSFCNKVNQATTIDIQFYREFYNKDCIMPIYLKN